MEKARIPIQGAITSLHPSCILLKISLPKTAPIAFSGKQLSVRPAHAFAGFEITDRHCP
ncbi:MAG: hypothetical protein K9K82_11615 [Desulfobacteraceae bacterium]|nr:hypothetical protein [Desulfobacteraceae bacterium]